MMVDKEFYGTMEKYICYYLGPRYVHKSVTEILNFHEPKITIIIHIQSVPPKWGQLGTQFSIFKTTYICQKVRPV